MRFETDRLFLRPWTEDDAEKLLRKYYRRMMRLKSVIGSEFHFGVKD